LEPWVLDLRKFAGTVMWPLEFAGSREAVHLRFVEGKAQDLSRHDPRGGGAEPESAAE